MQTRRLGQIIKFFLLVLLVCAGGSGLAGADSASSTNYKVSETHFGSGGTLSECSTNYCAKASFGDAGVGSASSTNYKARFGSITTDVPLLEVIAEAKSDNLGVLDTSTTATASRYIKVRNYLSHGYVIQITGSPPSQGAHSFTPITTPSTSHAGAEQFGINLVANTSPSVGANPVQVPNSGYSYGYATTDYGTANLFKYVDGDIIARSDSESGETDYTVSFIINISNVTPGGQYIGHLSAVVTSTF